MTGWPSGPPSGPGTALLRLLCAGVHCPSGSAVLAMWLCSSSISGISSLYLPGGLSWNWASTDSLGALWFACKGYQNHCFSFCQFLVSNCRLDSLFLYPGTPAVLWRIPEKPGFILNKVVGYHKSHPLCIEQLLELLAGRNFCCLIVVRELVRNPKWIDISKVKNQDGIRISWTVDLGIPVTLW